MVFEANITGNRRDTDSPNPKALLTNIKPTDGLFRDHCWVALAEVEAFQPKGHDKPKNIKFTAEIVGYPKDGTVDYTLRNIQLIED